MGASHAEGEMGGEVERDAADHALLLHSRN